MPDSQSDHCLFLSSSFSLRANPTSEHHPLEAAVDLSIFVNWSCCRDLDCCDCSLSSAQLLCYQRAMFISSRLRRALPLQRIDCASLSDHACSNVWLKLRPTDNSSTNSHGPQALVHTSRCLWPIRDRIIFEAPWDFFLATSVQHSAANLVYDYIGPRPSQ